MIYFFFCFPCRASADQVSFIPCFFPRPDSLLKINSSLRLQCLLLSVEESNESDFQLCTKLNPGEPRNFQQSKSQAHQVSLSSTNTLLSRNFFLAQTQQFLKPSSISAHQAFYNHLCSLAVLYMSTSWTAINKPVIKTIKKPAKFPVKMPPKSDAPAKSAATKADEALTPEGKLMWAVLCQLAKDGKIGRIDWEEVAPEIEASTGHASR